MKSTDTKKPTATRKPKANGNAIIAVVLILAGLAVLLYPVVATQWNNYGQRKAADAYSKLEAAAAPEVLHGAWEEAQRYNAERQDAQLADAWTSHEDESSPEYQRYLRYLSQLAETSVMARIVIPSIDSDLPVYHGTSDAVLDKGVGHLYGTDLPVGALPAGLQPGQPGADIPAEGRHAVLTAHTGLQTATLWDDLSKVKEGDAIYIAVSGQRMKYEVHDISVVLPEETDQLRRVPGEDLITLVTCTPYGINTHRLLVHAHRVAMEPDDADAFNKRGPHLQWWMWAILAAAALIIAALMWWWRRNFSTAKAQSKAKAKGKAQRNAEDD
ncbi:class C sortase [Corynebacterium sp.]|uniref:class C sortase n=1 Tax=Corynebacterium sp. TaxID=1720 RepID=UPI0026DC9C14|nr:class C sortase [Corynebacterium sp.]MDO5032433.1 class C sortase [Corynebacterium sp.]